jgi:hypothetical protein
VGEEKTSGAERNQCAPALTVSMYYTSPLFFSFGLCPYSLSKLDRHTLRSIKENKELSEQESKSILIRVSQ